MKKRIVFILLLLLIIIAILFCYKSCRDEETPICESLIFVAVNRIPNEEYNNWQIENQEYMYDLPAKDWKIGTGDGVVAIDASKIAKSDYATWLRINGNYIFFEETYPYIECAHTIDPSLISGIGTYTSLTLSQLKSQITTNGGSFLTTNYNLYTRLSFSTSSVMTLSMVDRYVANQNCFSVPLFRSIVDKHNLKNSAVFQFAQATVGGKTTTIFRVNTGGTYSYYDYSQIPP